MFRADRDGDRAGDGRSISTSAAPASQGRSSVGLIPPTSGSSSGCVSASRELILAIIQNPETYVNVHNAQYPAGQSEDLSK